jgi:hypothetical protein
MEKLKKLIYEYLTEEESELDRYLMKFTYIMFIVCAIYFGAHLIYYFIR